jgi:hypothetical protein
MKIWLWILVIFAELVVAVEFTVPEPNLGRISYRKNERYAALDAMHTNPSPATRAAYEQESHLASRHATHEWLLFRLTPLFALFLGLDFLVWFGIKRPPGTHGGG